MFSAADPGPAGEFGGCCRSPNMWRSTAKRGFPIWTDCRPHDGVHGAARPDRSARQHLPTGHIRD